MRSKASLVVRLLPVLDGVSTAFLFAWVVGERSALSRMAFSITLLIIPLWLELFRFFGLYASHRVETVGAILRRILTAHLAGLALLLAGFYAVGASGAVAAGLRFTALSMASISLGRTFLYWALRVLRRSGYDVRRVCVLGNWDTAQKMAETFSAHPEWGMAVACVGSGPAASRSFARFSPAAEPMSGQTLDDVLTREVIDEVVIAVSPEELPHEAGTMQLCEQYGLMARVLVGSGQPRKIKPTVEPFYGEVSIASGPAEYNEAALVLKRVLDVVAGLATLITAAPLMAVCALLVKISSPGPVFFRQARVGLHGRRFTMLKFRTMVHGADALIDAIAYRNSTKGPTFKDPRDGRVTEIGRVLRRFSLDELPQLLMVIKGDMSLVGPRPLPVRESERIQGVQRRRFSVRPGLTCLWQVNGRSDVEFSEWMKYDLQYVDRWSLWLDAKLLLQTIPAVLSGKGAY